MKTLTMKSHPTFDVCIANRGTNKNLDNIVVKDIFKDEFIIINSRESQVTSVTRHAYVMIFRRM